MGGGGAIGVPGSVGGSGNLGGATAIPGGGGNLTAGMGPGAGRTSSFQRQVNNTIPGIDLLLMIDNSSSMGDKQATLAAAVPQLLGQLVQPNCVDANGQS